MTALRLGEGLVLDDIVVELPSACKFGDEVQTVVGFVNLKSEVNNKRSSNDSWTG